MGESEAALKGVFVAATAAAPCVVLLDEIDALAPARAGGDGLGGRGATRRRGSAAGGSMSARGGGVAEHHGRAGADNDDTISLIASSSSPRPTGPRRSTGRCVDRVGSIERLRSGCPPQREGAR